MAKKVKFVPNQAGYIKLRQSPQVQAVIDAEAQKIKHQADSALPAGAAPFHADTRTSRFGTVGMVRTTDAGNRRANRHTNALLKGFESAHRG